MYLPGIKFWSLKFCLIDPSVYIYAEIYFVQVQDFTPLFNIND